MTDRVAPAALSPVFAGEPAGASRRPKGVRRRLLAVSILVLVVAGACGDDSPTATTGADGQAVTSTTLAGSGEIAVGVEDVGGHLTEGFRLSLRFELADGTVLAERTWEDIVLARPDLESAGIDAWYDTVHREVVPAGAVRLVSVMHPGMESAQPACTTDVSVDAGMAVEVTVHFWVHEDGTCATVGDHRSGGA